MIIICICSKENNCVPDLQTRLNTENELGVGCMCNLEKSKGEKDG